VLLQDIIKDEVIKLDWFFKASLIHDIVNVSISSMLTIITRYRHLSINIMYMFNCKFVAF